MTFDRTTGIGGSDVAAILGISPWRDQWDVWLEKTHNAHWVPPEESPQMHWGKLLEPVMAGEYARLTGSGLILYDWQDEPAWRGDCYAHLDGAVVDADGVVVGAWEGKTAGDDWDWFYGVPEYYEVQCRFYLAITGLPWIDLSVLFPRADFRTYRLEADPEYDEALLVVCQRWFDEFVAAGIAPPIDAGRGVSEYIARAYPRPTVPEPMVAPPGAEEIVLRLLEIAADRTGSKEEEETLRNRLRMVMGEYPAMEGAGWAVTWRKNQDTVSVDWALVAKAYRALLLEDAGPREAALLDTIEGMYTTVKEGNRPLVVRRTS